MSFRKHLEHFAQNTSMHGFGKVILTKKPEKRAAWVIVFVAAWALFAYQLTSVLIKYFEYAKKTTTEFVSGGAPFPAITLCNMQSMDFYVMQKFLKENDESRSIYSDGLKAFLNESGGNSSAFALSYLFLRSVVNKYWVRNETSFSELNALRAMYSRTKFVANLPTDAAEEIAIKKHEFIVNCTYGNSSCTFEEIPDPYYLKCFTFEPPNVRNMSFKDFRSLSEGIANGFSVTVFTGIKSTDDNVEHKRLPGVYEKGSPLSGSSGIRVVIHPPGTDAFPLIEGYDVPSGYQASIGIIPERRKRLGKPYGLCAKKNRYKSDFLDELRGIESDQDEPYRKISCERMCMQQQVIKECECIDDTLPIMGNMECYNNNKCWILDKNETQGNSLHLQEVPTCRTIASFQECAMNDSCDGSVVGDTLENIRCADDVIEKLMTDIDSLSKCNCYAPCDEFRYQVSYSLAKWPSSGYEAGSVYDELFREVNFKDRFAGEKKKMYKEYVERLKLQSLNDFAKINVYITDSNVLQIIEEPATTITQLISEIGGQLGIWIGVSVITISEVLETILNIATAGFRRLCSKSQSKIKDADEKTPTEPNAC